MNRSIAVVIAVLLMIVCTVLLTRNLKPGPSPTDILPVDTVALIEMQDLAGKINGFQASALGRQVMGADFPYILLQLGLPLSHVTRFIDICKIVCPFTATPVFSKMFSGQTVLALVPPGQGAIGKAHDLRQGAALIAQFPVKLNLADIVPESLRKRYKVSTSTYQGVTMLHLDLSHGFTLTAALHEGLLICGFSRLTVKRCLDVAISRIIQPVTGLPLNAHYSSIRQQNPQPMDFFLYAQMAGVLPLLLDNSSGTGVTPEALGVPEYIVASYWQVDRDVSRLQIKNLFADKVLPAFQHRYRLDNLIHGSRALPLPRDTQLYFRTSWFNMSALWQAALSKPSLPRAAVMLLLAQRVYEHTGLSINEFLGLFGSELAIYINDFGGDSSFPVPKISLRVEVNEQDRLALLLSDIVEDLPKQRQVAGGVPYVALQMGRGLMQPSYAFVDRAFLVADGREQLVRLLTVDGDTLSDQQDYQAVNVGFDQANVFEGFVRTNTLNKALHGLLSWIEKTCYASTVDCAQRTGRIVQYILRPLLESVNSIRANSIRGYLQGNTAIIEAAFYSTERPEPAYGQPAGED